MAFVVAPTYFDHPLVEVNLEEHQGLVKTDIDGWKLTFLPSPLQGLFDHLQLSNDSNIKVFCRLPKLQKTIWRESTAGGQFQRLSSFPAVKLAKVGRYNEKLEFVPDLIWVLGSFSG